MLGERVAAQTAAFQGMAAGVTKAFEGVRLPALPSQEARMSMIDEDTSRILRQMPDLSEVFLEALEMAIQKDVRYGGAWQKQGYMGNVARVLSKAARLKSMLWNDEPLDDTLEADVLETLMDLVNIAGFAVLNLREGNRWGE